MQKRNLVMILVSTVLIIGSVSLAVAATPPPLLASSDSQPPPGRVGTEAANVRILAITYWYNGVKHTLDPAVHDHVIPVTTYPDVFTFSVKALYTGPAGTTGQLIMAADNTDPYIESYKLLKPGRVTTMKCTNAWEPGPTDVSLYIAAAGPDFVPWPPNYQITLDVAPFG